MAAGAQQDDLAVAQNGGLVAQDNTEDGDVDGEEGDLDDDMMDKISSSPSIDDGGSACQLPFFENLLHPDASPGSSPASASDVACFSEARSSSPYLDPPDYLPIQRETPQHSTRDYVETPSRHHHHLPGAFPVDPREQARDNERGRGIGTGTDQDGMSRGGPRAQSYGELSCVEMASDPTAGEIMDAARSDGHSEKEQPDVSEVVCETPYEDEDDDELIIPYEDFTDEDDDDDFFLQSTDPRFIDSGWGGECLHDTEDIDFELVYALHTFIATVEGQANATKGDAMVLLDDSNSYWWLVRVVKDSSIGKSPSVKARGKRSDLTSRRLPTGRAHRNTH